MYLKSLELHGFKSFPNRTVLNFEPGATVIVGPNGSGKSNISDAMRWVLGEVSSRNIRGNKMEDVIFGGADTRRPMGFAEVSVTFDNTDPENRLDSEYDEITVTRRYYRTGNSDYLINHKPVHLRDIHKMFMNTGIGREGYSIIGQGRIAEILSRKSEDRRSIFEEAAGISRNRVDKEQAEKKLSANEIDLNRLRDIQGMLEARVGPLREEAENAKKAQKVLEEKKQIDVALWLFDTAKLRGDLSAAQDAFDLAKNELDTVREAIASLEAQREKLNEKANANTLRSESLYATITDCNEQMRLLDNAYRSISETLVQARSEIEQAKALLGSSLAESEALQKKSEELKSALASLSDDKDALKDEKLEILSELQQVSTDLVQTQKDLDQSMDALTKIQNDAADCSARIQMLDKSDKDEVGKGKELQDQIAYQRALCEKRKASVEEASESLNDFRERMKEIDTTLADAHKRMEELQEEKQTEQQKLGELRVSKDTALQRADALRRMDEQFDGYLGSVRYIMKEYEARHIAGVGTFYGPLAQLMTIDARYVTAIETILGANLQNIVVDNENTAKAAIAHLKKNSAGRATFYPVTTMKGRGESDESRRAQMMRGYIDRADRLITVDDTFVGVIQSLLMTTLVFDTLDNASEAARQLHFRIRIVTLDGQTINTNGSYAGGSQKRDSGVLSRSADIAKYEAEAAKYEELIVVCRKNIEDIAAEVAEAEAAETDAVQNKEMILSLITGEAANEAQAKANYEATVSFIERLEEEYSSFASTKARTREDSENQQRELTRLNESIAKKRALRAEMGNDYAALQHRKEELNAMQNDNAARTIINTKDIEVAMAELSKVEEQLRQLNLINGEKNTVIRDGENKIAYAEREISENRTAYEEKKQTLDAATEARKETVSDGAAYKERENELHNALREKHEYESICTANYEKTENRLSGLQSESDRIGGKLYADYEITYEEAVSMVLPEITDGNHSEFAKRQATLNSEVRKYTNCNLASIEEYNKVKDEYETMTSQVNDLETSCNDLRNIICKIEEEMRQSFITAFEKINHHFGETFRELFGGGEAELSLTEPEEILTSGIEIKAAPPGKIIKSLALLSGGEQTFVAIALLFAIIKVNPTPFCIFDEIEAALDEVNVYRFAAYVKKLCSESQFILITHRRGTMEIGNRLYGITMPEHGISRAVFLDIDAVEKMKKEAESWDSSKS